MAHVTKKEVAIPIGEGSGGEGGAVVLHGTLALPSDPQGLVLFAHGSGSSRFSPRNQFVAGELNKANVGTLLMDLLTEKEAEEDERTREFRFDLPRLAHRLVQSRSWLNSRRDTAHLKVGLFGASTGAGAALIAAAKSPLPIDCVVSRGGRVDLAESYLAKVTCPVMCLVGGEDTQVLAWNSHALRQIPASKKQLIVIKGATHLFEESGALEQVSHLAATFFQDHLTPTAVST